RAVRAVFRGPAPTLGLSPCARPCCPAPSYRETLVEKHGRASHDLLEPDPRVGGAGHGVEVVDVQTRDPTAAYHCRRQGRGARGAESAAAIVGMHPHTLDLPDCGRLRSDLRLEDHLAAFEAG